ncbi:zinc ribbon domain-containing protein [Candidatus Persebacteraceae bacterium Df01]|jgi:putative FmdB family regulatory protein|uniref:Zinc ribbon domain-containing protein n=1 Tax=Candidatus Doriopsillibacter californiensis TaxID=2970740 RepID=A0ABT7QLC7_9GAMM|nr:zinc ribbon domain-containing protein [Candidatus Persebacteraceae bacterium Df01]
MPIYEYQCKQCGHQDSDMDSINAPRVKKCPSCGKRSFSRLISASSFQLKGSGWYATDFRNNDKADNKTEKEKKTDKANAVDDGKTTTKKPDKKESKTENKKGPKEAA